MAIKLSLVNDFVKDEGIYRALIEALPDSQFYYKRTVAPARYNERFLLQIETERVGMRMDVMNGDKKVSVYIPTQPVNTHPIYLEPGFHDIRIVYRNQNEIIDESGTLRVQVAQHALLYAAMANVLHEQRIQYMITYHRIHSKALLTRFEMFIENEVLEHITHTATQIAVRKLLKSLSNQGSTKSVQNLVAAILGSEPHLELPADNAAPVMDSSDMVKTADQYFAATHIHSWHVEPHRTRREAFAMLVHNFGVGTGGDLYKINEATPLQIKVAPVQRVQES